MMIVGSRLPIIAVIMLAIVSIMTMMPTTMPKPRAGLRRSGGEQGPQDQKP